MTLRISSIIKGLVITAIAVAGWFFLAPTQLGGSATYLIIKGVSMEPSIKQGDIVIARERSSYKVGDVAAYRDTLSKTRVLHRIIARNGDHYTFKGDHNSAKDAFQPTQNEIVGYEWIHVPRGGTVLTWIQKPTNAAILAIGAMILAASGGAVVEEKKRRRRVKGGPAAIPPPRAKPRFSPLVFLPIALLVFSGLLALSSFGRSSRELVTVPDLYQQVGTFSYSGQAKPGPVYPDGTVSTGQTAFSNLVSTLDIRFRYEVRSKESAVIHGQTSLNMRLSSDETGWSRLFVLTPSKSFSGQTTTVSGTINLGTLAQLSERLKNDTGAQANSYHLALLPLVTTEGMIGSQRVSEKLAPQLDFIFDGKRLELDRAGEFGSTHYSNTGSGSSSRASTIDLRVATLTVPDARIVSLVGLALGLLGLLGVSVLMVRSRLGDEPRQIDRLYNHLLLPVLQLPPLDRIVEVDSIDALATLADRYDRAILHHTERGVHTYILQDDGLVYRYAAFDHELLQPAVGAAYVSNSLAPEQSERIENGWPIEPQEPAFQPPEVLQYPGDAGQPPQSPPTHRPGGSG